MINPKINRKRNIPCLVAVVNADPLTSGSRPQNARPGEANKNKEAKEAARQMRTVLYNTALSLHNQREKGHKM